MPFGSLVFTSSFFQDSLDKDVQHARTFLRLKDIHNVLPKGFTFVANSPPFQASNTQFHPLIQLSSKFLGSF
jgi:hypothetical protein